MGLNVAGQIGGFMGQQNATNAANKARIEQYKYQLKIRQKKWASVLQDYTARRGQYDFGMKAADRSAARAYGAGMYNQSQAYKAANVQLLGLTRALAASTGSAAAAGKTGSNAARSDRMAEANFVRNQAMLAQNLLSGAEAQSMNDLNIQDQLTSRRNQLYSTVQFAPEQPLAPMAPQMAAGPNPLGLMAGIGSTIVGGINQIQGMQAPDPGNFGAPAPVDSGMSLGTSIPGSLGTMPTSPLQTTGINFFGAP